MIFKWIWKKVKCKYCKQFEIFLIFLHNLLYLIAFNAKLVFKIRVSMDYQLYIVNHIILNSNFTQYAVLNCIAFLRNMLCKNFQWLVSAFQFSSYLLKILSPSFRFPFLEIELYFIEKIMNAIKWHSLQLLYQSIIFIVLKIAQIDFSTSKLVSKVRKKYYLIYIWTSK